MKLQRRKTKRTKKKNLKGGDKKSDKESNSTDKIKVIATWVRRLIPVVVVVVLLYYLRKVFTGPLMDLMSRLLGNTLKTGATTAIALETMLRTCMGVKGKEPTEEQIADAKLTFGNVMSTDCPAGEMFVGYWSYKLVLRPLYDNVTTWRAAAKEAAKEAGEGGESGMGAMEQLFKSMESLQQAGKSGMSAMSSVYNKVLSRVGEEKITELLESSPDIAEKLMQAIQKQVLKEVANSVWEDLPEGSEAATFAVEAAETFGQEAVILATELKGAEATGEGGELLLSVLENLVKV
jgi:hypothetical protein